MIDNNLMKQNIIRYIKEVNKNQKVVVNCNNIIDQYMFDIYIPHRRLAIDFVIYPENKDKDYHYNKTKICRELGVNLITIFEYEWRNEAKQKLLREYLRNILIDKIDLDSDQLDFCEISRDDALNFLKEHSRDYGLNSTIYLGFKWGKRLALVMGLRSVKNDAYIEALAQVSDINITNGYRTIFNYIGSKYRMKDVHIIIDLSKQLVDPILNCGFKPKKYYKPISHFLNGSIALSNEIKNPLIYDCGYIEYSLSDIEVSANTQKIKTFNTKRKLWEPGTKYGYWTVVQSLDRDTVLCKCVCGIEKKLYKSAVTRGRTLSCGCKRSENRKKT